MWRKILPPFTIPKNTTKSTDVCGHCESCGLVWTSQLSLLLDCRLPSGSFMIPFPPGKGWPGKAPTQRAEVLEPFFKKNLHNRKYKRPITANQKKRWIAWSGTKQKKEINDGLFLFFDVSFRISLSPRIKLLSFFTALSDIMAWTQRAICITNAIVFMEEKREKLSVNLISLTLQQRK